MDLKTVRTEVEAMWTALQRARAQHLAGRAPPPDVAALVRTHPEACSTEALSLARSAQASAEGRRARRLGALAAAVYELCELNVQAPALSRRAAVLAQARVTGPAGESLTLREADAALAQVTSRADRAGLERRLSEACRALESPAAQAREAADELAARVGFDSGADAQAALGGFDRAATAEQCRRFLSRTDAMYADVLRWRLRRTLELPVWPDGAERHDLLHVLEGRELDGLAPRVDLLRPVAGRLAWMELDPVAQGRVRLDADARAGKSPVPATAPVQAPSEVHVVVPASGGFGRAALFLRALGEAQHFAHIEAARPFEDRALGDQSVPLAWGRVFERWLCDRRWLKRVLDAEGPDLARLVALRELFLARVDAARWLQENERATSGDGVAARERAAEAMSQATLGLWRSELLALDAAPLRALTARVQSWALMSALVEHLRDRFDEDWWANPRSGPALRTFFAAGQFEPAAGVAEQIGAGALSLDRLAGQYEALLGG